MPLDLLITAGLIVLNACFVLAELSLVKVRSSRIELLARRGDARAALVQGMLQKFDIYLSACQLGITMASLGIGWIGEPSVAGLMEAHLAWLPFHRHELSFVIAFFAITFTHIVTGELVPRSVALQKSELLALWLSFPLRAFTLAFKIPITAMAETSMAILRLLRLPPASEAESLPSEDEMRIILGASEEKGRFSLERLLLLENVFDFGTAKVAEALTPSSKIACLSLAKSWEENLAVIRERRFSRYPLCEAGLESVTGLVHVKDLALAAFSGGAGAGGPDLRAARRDIASVSPDDPLQKLLRTFPDRGVHMALVRGPQGAVAGLVTLEDIFEELVGEVFDEFDLPQAWSLMDVLAPSAVEVGVEAADRWAVIRRLIDRLKAAYPPLDAEEAMKTVWERETTFSSGIGHGVAIPHGRLKALDRALVAVARSSKPLPFSAPDKLAVRLVFLILTPAAAPVAQLKILARIASLVSNENLRRRLLRVKTAEGIVETLRTADTVLASP